MADILRFKPRSASGSRRNPLRGKTGKIVIFPGIRYDRSKDSGNGDGPAPTPAEGARGSK